MLVNMMPMSMYSLAAAMIISPVTSSCLMRYNKMAATTYAKTMTPKILPAHVIAGSSRKRSKISVMIKRTMRPRKVARSLFIVNGPAAGDEDGPHEDVRYNMHGR